MIYMNNPKRDQCYKGWVGGLEVGVMCYKIIIFLWDSHVCETIVT
jgi:hypothetical protein